MTPNKTKPIITSQPAAIPPASPKTKAPAHGIEPGSCSGYERQFSGPPPVDPDAKMIAKVQAMDGSAMRHWLKQGTNRQDYDRALANRGKNNVNR